MKALLVMLAMAGFSFVAQAANSEDDKPAKTTEVTKKDSETKVSKAEKALAEAKAALEKAKPEEKEALKAKVAEAEKALEEAKKSEIPTDGPSCGSAN